MFNFQVAKSWGKQTEFINLGLLQKYSYSPGCCHESHSQGAWWNLGFLGALVQVIEDSTAVVKLVLAGCYIQWEKACKELAGSTTDQCMGIDFAVLVECT